MAREEPPCLFCLSPKKFEIEVDYKTRRRIDEIYTKYKKDIKIKKFSDFGELLVQHIAFHSDVRPEKRKPTLDSYSEKLLELGMKKLDQLETDPSKVRLSDVNTAQRLILERNKLKLSESAMMLSMAKLFGIGIKSKGEVVEGEIVKEEIAEHAGNS